MSGEIVQRLCGGPSSPVWEWGSVAALSRTSRLKQSLTAPQVTGALPEASLIANRQDTAEVAEQELPWQSKNCLISKGGHAGTT